LKLPELFRTIFQIALLAASAGTVVVWVILYSFDLSTGEIVTGIGCTFAAVYATCFLSGRFLITKFYYAQLRTIYKAIFQFTVQIKGMNTIPKKIADYQLKSEMFRTN
jgi:hypothetical protein